MKLIIHYDMKDSSIKIVRLTLRRSAIMPDWASRWLLMLRPLEALQPPTEVFSQGDDHDHGGESALEILGKYLGVSPNSFASFWQQANILQMAHFNLSITITLQFWGECFTSLDKTVQKNITAKKKSA